MALRTGHGKGAGVPRIEVLPPDELPSPVPAPAAAKSEPLRRRSDGRFADPDAAKEAGRRGGLARARRIRLVDSLGLAEIDDQNAFAPYRRYADEFLTAHLANLASVAGGHVTSGPATMVGHAALQLAGSRFSFDMFAQTHDPTWMKLGSSLGNDSRQNLLAAYELAVREAKARASQPNLDPLAGFYDEPEAKQ